MGWSSGPSGPSSRTVNMGVEKETLEKLEEGLDWLGEQLIKEVNDIPTRAYLEAKRYLNNLGDAVRALRHSQVGKFLDGTYAARGQSVAELVEHLHGQKLHFAPALPGQEAAYQALYRALTAYRTGLADSR